jgi:hypothetical protein
LPEPLNPDRESDNEMHLKVAIFSLLLLFLLTTLSGQSLIIPPGEYFSRDDSSWYFRKTGITQYLIANSSYK